MSLGDVSGIGRTTLCELLQSVWRDQGLTHSRYHTAADQPRGPGRSKYIELSSGHLANDVINWMDLSSLVMLDVATGEAGAVLDDYLRGDLSDMLAEIDCSITLLATVSDDVRTEKDLLRLAEHFRADAEYVVVRREGGSRTPAGWQNAACQRAMHHLGAIELEMPAWPAPLADLAARERWHALDLLAQEATLPRTTQPWLYSWRLESAGRLAEAADLLWPEGLEPCESFSMDTVMRPARRGRKPKSAAGKT